MELEDRIRRWNEEADQAWADAVKARKIIPRKARTYVPPLVVIRNVARGGRANPVVLRQLLDTITTAEVKSGKGAKKNLQLLYDLAVWQSGRKKRHIPKRGLAKHVDDALWRILQQHDEVPFDCPGFDHLHEAERGKLELRLYHHWPTVEKLAAAFLNRTSRASNARRKPVKSFISALQPMRGKTIT